MLLLHVSILLGLICLPLLLRLTNLVHEGQQHPAPSVTKAAASPANE